MMNRSPVLRLAIVIVAAILLCAGGVLLLTGKFLDNNRNVNNNKGKSANSIDPEMIDQGNLSEPMGLTSGRNRKAVNRIRLNKAINLSANYLIRACDDSGKFIYRINLDPNVTPKPRYNILRHAGTIYALAMYERVYHNEDARHTLDRAVRFLKRRAIASIPGRDDLLAVWSYPEMTGGRGLARAKLGGTGLGLAALLSVEKIKPGTTSINYLRKMGRFLLFMQKQDGSFYSRYILTEGGKTDEWTSLYYPGEAALGLLMLYEKDPSPMWLQAAANGIAYLAGIRSGEPVVEADHWALLATARLLPVYHCCKQPVSREQILQHAVQICESILDGKTGFPENSMEYGCITDDGRTCPTATRLEGLLAASIFLPAEKSLLQKRITSTVIQGISFLLRSQIPSGSYAGGIPRAIRQLPAEHPQFTKSFNKRATEVRIDYVQHALSAMIQFDQLFCPTSHKI